MADKIVRYVVHVREEPVGKRGKGKKSALGPEWPHS